MLTLLMPMAVATAAAAAAAAPPQPVWPQEFRAAVNESAHGVKGPFMYYDTEYSFIANAEQRIVRNQTVYLEFNTSTAYTQDRGGVCTRSHIDYPMLRVDLSAFKYTGNAVAPPFGRLAQVWTGTYKGQPFQYHCSTDGLQTPIGFAGLDESVEVLIEWFIFVPAVGKSAFPPGYFSPPADCPA